MINWSYIPFDYIKKILSYSGLDEYVESKDHFNMRLATDIGFEKLLIYILNKYKQEISNLLFPLYQLNSYNEWCCCKNTVPSGKYVVILENLDFKNPPYKIIDCKCVTRENAACRSNYMLPFDNANNYLELWALRKDNSFKIICSPNDVEKMITIIAYDPNLKYDVQSCFMFDSNEPFCILWGEHGHFDFVNLSRKCILSGSRI